MSEDNIEKGFDEGELADIMNEIENLEKEFEVSEVSNDKVAGASAPQGTSETEAPIGKKEGNEVESDVEEQSVKNNVISLVGKNNEVENKSVNRKSFGATGNETTLDFNVSGNIKFNLNFNFGSEMVELKIDHEKGLKINMSNGVEFTIPVATMTSQNNLKTGT